MLKETLTLMAGVLEATARKPGNVHRFADFQDATYLDFLLSAIAIGPVMERARQQGVGQTILEAVQATRQVVTNNTNLGIILLLAPLAAVPEDEELRQGVARVLQALTRQDAKAAYKGIRLARPGGMGKVARQDVTSTSSPRCTLLEAMRMASDRDWVARQYANNFQEVFEIGCPAFQAGLRQGLSLEGAIVRLHLELMAALPDTLIARKRGQKEALEAGRRAREVIDSDWPTGNGSLKLFEELDHWLRACGNGRNPGTTADLVTAVLYISLRQGCVSQEHWTNFASSDFPIRCRVGALKGPRGKASSKRSRGRRR